MYHTLNKEHQFNWLCGFAAFLLCPRLHPKSHRVNRPEKWVVQATKWGSSHWERLVLSQLIYCLKARKFLKGKLLEEEPSRWGNSIGLIKPVERVLHSMYFSIYSSNSTNTDFAGLGNVCSRQWFSVISDVQHASNKLKMLRHHYANLRVFYQKESYVKQISLL